MASTSPLVVYFEKVGFETEGVNGFMSKVIDVNEARTQLLFSVPMILTNMSYYAVTLVAVMFAGHLGDVELAGATLGNSWGTVTGLSLMTGLSGALETLCGQGYGAKQYRMLGINLQSSIILTTFASIIVSILWYFSEPVLLLLHQDPSVAKMATIYLRFLIPGLFAHAYIQCLVRFLQTQSLVVPLVICSLLPLVFDVGLTYLFVHTLGLGFIGSPLASSISLWISVFMLAIYVNYSEKFRYTWEGLSMESFHHVFPSLKLAISSALMMCLECCAFEILVLLAGLMPNSENSTSLVAMCVQTEGVAYMITYGFSAAVSTRVSNEMGAGNIKKAKNAVSVTLKLSFFLALMFLLSLAFGQKIWAKSFTTNAVIIKEFASMIPLLSVSILLGSAQGVLSGVSRGCGWQHLAAWTNLACHGFVGVSRGCGWQHLAAWTNLACFYLFGMPVVLLFGFKLGFYDKGLWLGLICGLFSQATTLLVITIRSKWTNLDLVAQDQKIRLLV
ncbi:protein DETOXIFICATION 18-like [Asparagus officinalis]|uniref:protein DETOXIFICATION 18-like n=1 Tax=Asparagus officinalis TaxID=4686 RepID=UPI00098E0866|nr:protein DETOXIFICATION 18-like [Asparagus officinalis]